MVRIANIGLAAALAVIHVMRAEVVYPEYEPRYEDNPKKETRKLPNDIGPVVDSTPETKRAKRRRIQHERRGMAQQEIAKARECQESCVVVK